jgi:ArsR family transcriptional regulator
MQTDGLVRSNDAFHALADRTRREILQMLRTGPQTSGDIAARFESSWPTISRHLAVLRNAGLVVAVRKGQEIYYELDTTVFQELIQHLVEWLKPPALRRVHRHKQQEV